MHISIPRPKQNISVVGMLACQNSSKHYRTFFLYIYIDTFEIHLKQSHLDMKNVRGKHCLSQICPINSLLHPSFACFWTSWVCLRHADDPTSQT